MMYDYEKIPWDEVESAAGELFHVWMDNGDLKWAQEAWQHLSQKGLTGRRNALEETSSCLRLLVLAQMYWGFCRCAWDENAEQPLEEAVDALALNPFALGILAGKADLGVF